MTGKRKAKSGRLIQDSHKAALEAMVDGLEWGPDIARHSGNGAQSSSAMAGLIGRQWAVRADSTGSQFARYGLTDLGIHALTYARIERGEYADMVSSRKRFADTRNAGPNATRGAGG